MKPTDFIDRWRDIGDYAAFMRAKYPKMKHYRSTIQNNAETEFVKIQRGSLDSYFIDDNSKWFLENIGLPPRFGMMNFEGLSFLNELKSVNKGVSFISDIDCKFFVVGFFISESNCIVICTFDSSVWNVSDKTINYFLDYSMPGGYRLNGSSYISANIIQFAEKMLALRNLNIEIAMNPQDYPDGNAVREEVLARFREESISAKNDFWYWIAQEMAYPD